MLHDILIFLHLHLRSHRRLAQDLGKKLSRNGLNFYPEFSGRVAIYRLACELALKLPARRALIPDYLCNVVAVALEKAGYECFTYPTDARFEADPAALRRQIEKERIGLLLTASLYGSGALLDHLKKTEMRDFLRSHQVHTIVDCCQDIRLIDHLPEGYGTDLSAVVSFNDKSFPGAMGGGVLAGFPIPPPQNCLRLLQVWRLYKRQGGRWLRVLRKGIFRNTLVDGESNTRSAKLQFGKRAVKLKLDTPKRFEYSYCREFPYQIEPYRPAKIQLIMALIGLRNLDKIEHQKAQNAAHCPNIRSLPFVRSAAYWVIDGDWDELPPALRRRKLPYARHGQPAQSIHEDLLIIYSYWFTQ